MTKVTFDRDGQPFRAIGLLLSLLGCDTLEARARRLLEILEFHALERTSGRRSTLH